MCSNQIPIPDSYHLKYKSDYSLRFPTVLRAQGGSGHVEEGCPTLGSYCLGQHGLTSAWRTYHKNTLGAGGREGAGEKGGEGGGEEEMGGEGAGEGGERRGQGGGKEGGGGRGQGGERREGGIRKTGRERIE